jgi:hypothetical protein
MTEQPDREPERELEDLEERAERLEEDTDATRKDWESKKQDPGVPGAVPDADADDNVPPEADEPS